MRTALAASLALLLAAGCLGSSSTSSSGPAGPRADPALGTGPASPTLTGIVEPAAFDAPTFRAPVTVSTGSAAYSGGEPGIAAARDGSIVVSFPGCDEGTSIVVAVPGEETCDDGVLHRSVDGGKTWTRLNRHPDGRLDPDGEPANGDADVTVDSAGNLYATNLGGGGIQFLRSLDGGATWKNMANIVPTTADKTDDPKAREGADRQWLAAAGPGHVINAWMRTSPKRDVRLNTTFDGGVTWVGNLTFGEDIGWLGTVAFAPDGMHAYVPYTKGEPGLVADPVGFNTGGHFMLHVLRTADGGLSWDDVKTGLEWDTSYTGLHWSGGYMAPALGVTGDGMVVVAAAVDSTVIPSAAPFLTPQGTHILLRTSRDLGKTWSDTVPLGENSLGNDGPVPVEEGMRIFPWIAGGAGDRFALSFMSAPTPVQSDYAGTLWSVEAMVFDGAAEGKLVSHEVLVQSDVHEGPVCARGGLCAFPVDRTLLDYFECTVLADGRLAIVYPADSATNARALEIRVAVQDGGSLLFERASPTPAQA